MAGNHVHGSYPELNYGSGAKWIKNLTKDRLGGFNGGRYSDLNLASVLSTHRLDSQENVKLKVWSAPGRSKPTFNEAIQQKFKTAKKGDTFGPSWVSYQVFPQPDGYFDGHIHIIEASLWQITNHWWKVTLTIPKGWRQYERVQFEFDPGCEAMIYTVDGNPVQGITGGFSYDRRVEYIIPREAIEQEVYELVIESSCNGMFGVSVSDDIFDAPDMNRYFSLASAELVVPNVEAWGLLWDFQTLREIVDTLPGNTPLQNKALTVANNIMNVFNKNDPSTIGKARKLAEEVFGEGWEAKGASVYDEGPKKVNVWGIGHCHIDTAHLWPYRVTQQKVARSWSTQVDLMDRYPELRFSCTSAQQYKWLEELYPSLFERVKEKILDGKFQPVGGSWVESDCNMPSGESLIRQFLFGQRYFETKFGKRCETSFLPDSFGMSGALPQLMRGAGMKYFLATKLSWNNINVFPHTSFNWVGIDGTQVLCHLTPMDTYFSQATVDDVNKGFTNHKNLESSDISLLVFGNGDGGGGPSPKMLENLRRIKATTNTHRELPSISMGRSADEFFVALDQQTAQGKTLPNWNGELYLEFHRGTYTSHGSIKKANRLSEILLRDLEQISTLASLYTYHNKDYIYPKEKIDLSWEKVLLNQFHDVLPGSSIGLVYEDAEAIYAEVKRDGDLLVEEAFSVLIPKSVPLTPATTSKPLSGSCKIVAYNTTFFPRWEIIKVPLTKAGSQLKSQILQASDDCREGYAIMHCAKGAGLGELKSPSNAVHAHLNPVSIYTNGSDHFVLRNSSVQLTISKGRITSLVDVKLNRELIPQGRTGGLVIFQDRPNAFDAWDVEIYHLETAQPLEFSNVSIITQGPLRAAVRAEVKYGQSTISITISLDATTATVKENSRSLFNFDAYVDWHQRHEFLKFELPLDIRSDYATYETQFGYVQRPTHKNTTWDIAKFEVCGHKYADLSEFGYGVAFLSESKYGFSCQGNVLRMSLLRAATAPDTEQDQGEHRFSWAVMPHEGHFLESDVPVAGHLYNSPLRVRCLPAGTPDILSSIQSPFVVDGARNVFLETVKRGEYDSFEDVVDLSHNKSATTTASVILRLYEAYGGHAHAKILISRHLPVLKAFTTNLLEDEDEELYVLRSSDSTDDFGSILSLSFRGFEVKTIKLVLAGKQPPPKLSNKQAEKRSSWVTVDHEGQLLV